MNNTYNGGIRTGLVIILFSISGLHKLYLINFAA